MKFFSQLLVAPAALGLLAPLSTNASEVNISEIDVIICGSLHALRAIHDNHEAQLKAKDMPMVVVSARIAVLACKFGYRRIICSRGANIESIVACVTCLNIRQAR